MNIYLSNKNKHMRDENTSLDEKTHIYNIKGHTDYTSMTTFIHSLFDDFDENKKIDNMMKSQNWSNNKYFGKSKQDILNLWEKNKVEASTAGTKMHYDIECFYNNNIQENNSPEYKYFLNFNNTIKNKLKPYRTEWIVYDEDAKIAGSIDMVYKHKSSDILDIYDWKRCKQIIKNPTFNKWSNNKITEHLPDSNFWHYSLQLNGYKYILTNKYKKKVKDLFLVSLHPNNNDFQLFKCPNLQDEISKLFQQRITTNLT